MLDKFLKPLSADYCLYFYLISLWFLISLVVLIGGSIMALVGKKPLPKMFYLGTFYAILINFALYFQNRLLYGMCIKSL